MFDRMNRALNTQQDHNHSIHMEIPGACQISNLLTGKHHNCSGNYIRTMLLARKRLCSRDVDVDQRTRNLTTWWITEMVTRLYENDGHQMCLATWLLLNFKHSSRGLFNLQIKDGEQGEMREQNQDSVYTCNTINVFRCVLSA